MRSRVMGAPARARAQKVTTLRTVARWQPPVAPSAIATELWIGAHLPAAQIESFRKSAQHAEPQRHLPSYEASAVPHDERHLLERLAARAQWFTPRVSLAPPDGLLLEVKGSLHLFNGVEGLCRALAHECTVVGVQPVLALAPTPLAALVTARAGKPFAITDMAQLVGQLAPLPLMTLRWPQEVLDRLALVGVRTIGQALRLPRAGFARRFGSEHLAMLDRLTGRDADLRERFHARERFRRRRELTYELESHDVILAALAPLLTQLGKFLEARQCGIVELECLLRHRHAPPSRCILRLAAPAADARRLTELLGERLAMLTLPEPVRACELRSGSLVARVLSSSPLWQPGEHGGGADAESSEFIERLRARLGPEAVYSLQILRGHRPENAWSVTEPDGASLLAGRKGGLVYRGRAHSSREASRPPWPAFRRPMWLLPVPQLLSERGGLPRRRGPLHLISEPERIETGWWDGVEIARDYYMAVDIHGVRLWIFRERLSPHRWFLHGVFG